MMDIFHKDALKYIKIKYNHYIGDFLIGRLSDKDKRELKKRLVPLITNK